MSFLYPLAFLGLLLFIPVILLYLLKQRRARVTVSTLLFWDDILRDEHRVASVTRLRKLLSLLLQLLVLLLLILALARPILASDALGARRVVILVDVSASMHAREGERTRFDIARDHAHDVIAGLASGDAAMLVAVGPQPDIVVPLTESRRALREALDAVQPEHTPANLSAALHLLHQLPPDPRETWVYVVSDGSLDPVPFDPPPDMRFAFLAAGSRQDNIGIVAFQARPLPASPRDFEILFEVVNESDEPRTLPFALFVGDNLVDANEVTIPARGAAHRSIRQFSPEGGPVRLELETGDAFPLDDTAHAVLPAVEDTRVVLVTEGNLFLESALATADGIDLSVAPPAAYAPGAAEGGHAVYVFDGWAPENPPDAHAIYIGRWPATLGIAAEGEIADPMITDWERDHPINRRLSLANITIGGAPRLAAPDNFATLVSSFGQPLVLLDDTAEHRALVVAFNTAQSDLPLRAAFPMLIANAIQYLAEVRAEDTWRGPPLGAVLGLDELAPWTQGLDIARVLAPGESAPPEAPPAPIRIAVNKTGIYQGVTGEGDTIPLFGASLSHRRESNLDVSESMPVETAEPLPEIPDAFRAGAAPWRILAYAALALLAIEWWLFHRRWVE
ncbi:MAG: VWA domain-containing protein [Candidatus Hydrogenedentes bacterium]|nr:VWA domain-containing protein [Candidatus Hydrogenedentota bacterium]